MSKAYLTLYNLFQLSGWTLSLYKLLAKDSDASLYQVVYFFQALAILEILNVLLGVVRANFSTTFVQVFSRLQVLLIHYMIQEARECSGQYYMLLAWCLVEVVRYSYLAMHVWGVSFYPLTWLRYS